MGTGFLFQGKDGGLGKMMRHMSSGMMGFAGHTRSATASLKLMGQGFAAFTAGAKLLSGAFSAAKGFSEFEFKMASVSGITQATTRELKLLENAAISAGIATQFSPLEAAEGLEVLGATGFDAADSMTVLRSSLDLAAGSMGQLGVADAAAIASASLKAYGRDVGEAALMTDKLLRVTQLTNFQTRDMIGAFPKLMGKGSPFRQSFDDMLIAMGLMRNVGIDAFTAQTALSAAFMRLGSERRVQDAIKPFAKVFDEETKQMRPMMDIILDLAEVTKDWTDEKRQSLEATLAGRRGILSFSGVTRAVTKAILANREAVKLANGEMIIGEKGYRDLRAEIEKSGGAIKTGSGSVLKNADAVVFLTNALDPATKMLVKGRAAVNAMRFAIEGAEGAAEEFRKKLLDTFKGQMILLQGSAQTFEIVFGKAFAQVMRPAIEWMIENLNKLIVTWRGLDDGTKRLISKVVVLTGSFLMLAGTILLVKGVMGLLGISAKGMMLMMGKLMLTILPIVAIGWVMYKMFKVVREQFSKGSDDLDKFLGPLQKVKLGFQALVQLLVDGHLSDAMTKELGKAENEGLLKFVDNASQFFTRVGKFFDGMVEGIADAADNYLLPMLGMMGDAFSLVWDIINGGTGEFDKNKDAIVGWNGAGEITGKVLGGIATGILAVTAGLIILKPLLLFMRMMGAAISLAWSVTPFGAISLAIAAIAAGLLLLAHKWDEIKETITHIREKLGLEKSVTEKFAATGEEALQSMNQAQRADIQKRAAAMFAQMKETDTVNGQTQERLERQFAFRIVKRRQREAAAAEATLQVAANGGPEVVQQARQAVIPDPTGVNNVAARVAAQSKIAARAQADYQKQWDALRADMKAAIDRPTQVTVEIDGDVVAEAVANAREARDARMLEPSPAT